VKLSRLLAPLALVVSPLSAQDARMPALTLGDRFFEAGAGFSWFSPRGGNWGKITNRRVYLTGLRNEWVLGARGRFAWSYLFEWVPVAVVERTVAGQTLHCDPTGTSSVCEVDRSARVAVGTGAAPLGLKLYMNNGGSARFFGSGSGGMIAFTSDVPVYSSRKLNFMFDYGGGVDVVMRDGRALTIGYRFHHISNAGSGRVNPGLDANVIYVGMRKRR
jgi:opacity protein-like surface antigen